ncbi:uncharacterized protein PGTG_12315 [Puccinia graminis f. sp. tritici CRL 75-36-700-3]|uniref:Trafficking protein particle complex subunit 13 N-terminal domain-containing protein n=1 Tax=Puccinia graminis f. sp. tritici (strain CRL 75-36-700-3 / race SCCL) TaxID=418459 RepID=E3KPX4_PUCGT|nr:uncharacterized protein PGTG_12315 [Puccinia graminis f. sp. tritici CRL 75-36-700-3]EFP86359.2 hypothetical protein PGTG_12315 [Puccinia graminis f. sp. tritici CRL 75-36-700-3]
MNNNRAHLLSLKVLRSSPPTLNTTTNQPTQTEIADTLSLPNSFGTIYQGEAFNGLLSLRPEQPRSNLIAALNPKLIVELQSSQSLHKSLIGSIHAHQLGPASEHEALELLINHQITQLGLHSLICTVTYQEPPPTEPTEEEEDQELTPAESHQITPESEPQTRSFRKLYKFQVLNPLGIKTKTYRSPSSSSVLEETRVLESLKKVLAEIEAHDHHHYDDTALSSLFDGQDRLGNDGSSSNETCYMEIQIQNQSSKPLLNLTLNLLPQDQNPDDQKEEEGESTTRKIEQIQLKQRPTRTPTGAESDEQIMPGDIRQYAFKVDKLDEFDGRAGAGETADRSRRADDDDDADADETDDDDDDDDGDRELGLSDGRCAEPVLQGRAAPGRPADRRRRALPSRTPNLIFL